MPLFFASTTFGTFRQMGSDVSPPWLAGTTGTKFVYSLSIQLDGLAEYLRLGVLQRMPGHCQPEALPYIGADRHLLRGQQESDEAYTIRLQQAWQTWKAAGTPRAVLGQLAAYFSPVPPVLRYVTTGWDEGTGVTWADWWTLSNGVYTYQRVSPSNWDWDGQHVVGRFWIIIYLPTLTQTHYGDGHVYGGGQSYGFEGVGEIIGDIRSLIGTWKAAGSHAGTFDVSCDAGIILAGESTHRAIEYGDGFTYGDGHVYGQEDVVGLFDPNAPPGPPMPDGDWDDPANRNVDALYLSGI